MTELSAETSRSSAPAGNAMHGHPNRVRWDRAARNAERRGELVCDILSTAMQLRNAHILDAGCGDGGTSIALARHGARVTALDHNPLRLASLRDEHPDVTIGTGDIERLPFPDAAFDGAVLQDVIEHVSDPAFALAEIARVLRPGGVLYLSTPNRDALPNLLADPHFGLPFVARKSRSDLRRVLHRRRPADAERHDLAQLLSEPQLLHVLTEAGFHARFVNRAVAERLFREPEAVVWSRLHLTAVLLLRRSGLHRLVRLLARDSAGQLNRMLNPTFYLICRKETR